jgi:hypothetical protein
MGARERVKLVLRHLSVYGRKFGDLVTNRMRVTALQLGPAIRTDLRLDFDDFVNLFGRFEKPACAFVARLSPRLASRRLALRPGQMGRIAGGRTR